MFKNLNPNRALIFRITHKDNVAWILENGLHCKNAGHLDPNFVTIGNEDLIRRRVTRVVPIEPGGTLSDYIPFYFTPCSPMLYNIVTGRGAKQRSGEEIVVVVSSLHKVAGDGIRFIFSDRHAYLAAARFSADLSDLDWIDWPILQARDFRRDPNDMEKMERYQAEALVHEHLPIESLLGIICCTERIKQNIDRLAESREMPLSVVVRSRYFFR